MENQKSKSGSKSNAKNYTSKKSSNDEKIDVKINKNAILNTNANENANTNTKENKKDNNNIIFIVVEKNGSLKEVEIKESQIGAEELSKKCKFKKVDGFIKRTQWSYSSKSSEDNSSSKIVIELWAKNDGLANYENKYEFPPPVDNDLYFGCCALVARDTKNNYLNLKKEKWNKIYEYLFGGFESLVGNEDDDDEEEDELDSIPSNRKTRDGYLKDGFVVDGAVGGESDIEEDSDNSDDGDDEDSDSDESSGNSNDGDGDEDVGDGGEGGDGEDDTYSKKKNKIILVKNKLSKNKPKVRNTKEDDDDNYNSGWNTDESSELSEEEYSYSK